MTWLSDADHAALRGAKKSLRDAVKARRTARSDEAIVADDHARFEHVRSFVGDPAEGLVVASYLSIHPEPGTMELIAWLHTSGVRVLLPVLGRRADGSPRREPDWAPYAGPDALRDGLWNIPEPTTESLGAEAASDAAVIICSGLAGTTDGKRLGMGGGWFDRALEHAGDETVLVMLLNDDELLPDLPTEPWDRRVDVIVTPTQVIDTSQP